MPKYLVGVPHSGTRKPPCVGEVKLACATAIHRGKCWFMVTVSLDSQPILHFLNPKQPHNGLQDRFQVVWEHEPENHGLSAFQGKTRFHAERISY